jgi:hypothetical protein
MEPATLNLPAAFSADLKLFQKKKILSKNEQSK